MFIWRFLSSPANWVGLIFAIAIVLAKAFGYISAYWWALVAVGYLAGYWLGKTVFGAPKLVVADLEALDHALQNVALPSAMTDALLALKDIASANRGGKFSQSQQVRLVALTEQISDLHKQWLQSKQQLSIEDAFVAKRLALEYLPDTVRRYVAIPKSFATTKVIANGKTASQLFDESIDEMRGKVEELQHDLISHDAQAFANHAQFLHQKFGDQFSVSKALEKH
jgi:hypothetical protein